MVTATMGNSSCKKAHSLVFSFFFPLPTSTMVFPLKNENHGAYQNNLPPWLLIVSFNSLLELDGENTF